jgi:hypothetical protein
VLFDASDGSVYLISANTSAAGISARFQISGLPLLTADEYSGAHHSLSPNSFGDSSGSYEVHGYHVR